jgi:hypothetical protein
MNPTQVTYVLVTIIIAIAVAMAALTGLAAGIVACWEGATIVVAIRRAAATFVAALSLMLAVLTLVSIWVQ